LTWSSGSGQPAVVEGRLVLMQLLLLLQLVMVMMVMLTELLLM